MAQLGSKGLAAFRQERLKVIARLAQTLEDEERKIQAQMHEDVRAIFKTKNFFV